MKAGGLDNENFKETDQPFINEIDWFIADQGVPANEAVTRQYGELKYNKEGLQMTQLVEEPTALKFDPDSLAHMQGLLMHGS